MQNKVGKRLGSLQLFRGLFTSVSGTACAAIVGTALLTSACVSPRTNYVTTAGLDRIDRAGFIADRLAAVRSLCLEAGLPAGTRRHARCMNDYRKQDLLRLRAIADQRRQESVARHGLCIDKKTLTVEKCVEI